MAAFCQALCEAAAGTGLFPVAGLRVRASAANYFQIADGDPNHGFVDISVRLGAGRSHDNKLFASEQIFHAAQEACADLLASTPFLLSLEMREIDPDLSLKVSSIRKYLPEDLH